MADVRTWTLIALVAGLVLGACGGAAATPNSPLAKSPARHVSSGVKVGDVLLTSTLAAGSSEYSGLGNPSVVQGPLGTSVAVAQPQPGRDAYTWDEMSTASYNPIMHSLSSADLRVQADTSKAGQIFFGVTCEGVLSDFHSTYLLLTTTSGRWLIAEMDQGDIKALAQGSNAPTGSSVTVDGMCASPVPGMGSDSVRLALAVDGTVLGSVNVPKNEVGCCSDDPIVLSPNTQAGAGVVTFSNLSIRSAIAT